MSLIRNTTWSAVSAILLSGGRFLISIFLARKLGVEDFGKFAFIQWLMDIAVMFFAFGLPSSASRFFAELNDQSGMQTAFQKWFFLRCFQVAPLVIIGFPLAISAFGYALPPSALLALAGWGAASWTLTALVARAQGLMRFKQLAASNTVYVAVALGGCMLLPEQGNELIHVVLVMIAATVLAATILWSPLPRTSLETVVELSGEIQSSIKRFGLNIWITSLVSALIWSRGEMVLVQSFLGTKDVAMYSVALTLVGLATQGLMLLTGALGPHLTQMWGGDKLLEAQALCRNITNILTFSAAILSAFLILFGAELVLFAYGAQFQGADGILLILGFGAFGLASAAANQLLQIKTDGTFGRNSNLFGALCLFGLAFPLILFFGTKGAAASRVFIQIGIGLAACFFVSRFISSRVISWAIQVKSMALVTSLFFLQMLGSFTLCTRTIQFMLFSMLAIILLTEKQDRRKFLLLVRSFFSRTRW